MFEEFFTQRVNLVFSGCWLAANIYVQRDKQNLKREKKKVVRIHEVLNWVSL